MKRLVSLVVVAVVWPVVCPIVARAADADVRLSSIGYLPGRAKRASIVAPAAATFTLIHDGDGTVAASATTAAPIKATDTGETVTIADFSSVKAPGTYHLEVEGVGRSVSFPIGADVYQAAFVTTMLGFYGWRCGTAVAFDYGGARYEHAACHLDDAHTEAIGGTGVRDGKGGWHDAGDYGKYTVNAGITLGSLLAAWEEYKGAIEHVTLSIPETGGPLPDYLAEIKWELDWLLKMQYGATDGRVSHKITAQVHPAFIMPEDDLPTTDESTRSFVPYGTGATADFVAMLAKAARLYRPYDAAFADKCLAAAQISAAYLQANTANAIPNETGFISAQYASTDADDRLWAAAELWETTGDAAALADFEARANALPNTAANPRVSTDFDWSNLNNLGIYVYLSSARPGRNATLVASLTTALTAAANTLVTNHNAHAYGRALTSYYWGSNGSVARSCMLLQVANRLSPKADYLDTCSEQVAFLFGRNTFNRSQVTGLGRDPPLEIHHRPSAADGIAAPYPGLLVGGPWAYRAVTGPPAIAACTQPAGACWADAQDNYQVNEVAINWNAPLVYALASLMGAPQTTPVDAGVDAAPPDAGVTGAGGALGTGGGAGAGTGGGGAGGRGTGGVGTDGPGTGGRGSGATSAGGSGTGAAATGGTGAGGGGIGHTASGGNGVAGRGASKTGCGCITAGDAARAPSLPWIAALASAMALRPRRRWR